MPPLSGGAGLDFFFSFLSSGRLSPHPSSSRKIFDLSVQLLCKFDSFFCDPNSKNLSPFIFLQGAIWVGFRWILNQGFPSESRCCWEKRMGVMSRRVLPACGNLCFFCPSLRARSRHPVKRYKKMLAEIFPRNQVNPSFYILKFPLLVLMQNHLVLLKFLS